MKVYFKMHGPVCTSGVLSRSLVLNLKFSKRKKERGSKTGGNGRKKVQTLASSSSALSFLVLHPAFSRMKVHSLPLSRCVEWALLPPPHFAVKVVVAVEKRGLSTDVI